MFAESEKKYDATKRGRFNVGEKYVLAMCSHATVTSTSGRIIFKKNRTRTQDSVKTEVGTKFEGELLLTEAEYDELVKKVKLVVPPVPTFFNGEQLPARTILHQFEGTSDKPDE